VDKPEQLRDKAIDIKGKKYVLVSDRVIYFNDTYPDGSINTELISDPMSDQVIIKATIYPDSSHSRGFTGYSQAVKGDGMVNKTSALENAETSAVGRALAMMGIGVLDSIASVDEINKAQGSHGKSYSTVTPKQIAWIRKEVEEAFECDPDYWILTNLKLPVDKIPSFKVMDAIDKIHALAKEKATEQEKNEIVDSYKKETVREKAKRLYIDKSEDNKEDQELLTELRSEDEQESEV